jgi:hypothetical protein
MNYTEYRNNIKARRRAALLYLKALKELEVLLDVVEAMPRGRKSGK